MEEQISAKSIDQGTDSTATTFAHEAGEQKKKLKMVGPWTT